MTTDLAISDVTPTEVQIDGRPMLEVRYKLHNQGHEPLQPNTAWVSAVGDFSGVIATQQHWYDRHLGPGQAEDLNIHLEVPNGGAGNVSIAVCDYERTITQSDGVPFHVAEAQTAPVHSMSDAHVECSLVDVADTGFGARIHYRIENPGPGSCAVGRPVEILLETEYGTMAASQSTQFPAEVAAGQAHEDSVELVVDHGDYTVKVTVQNDDGVPSTAVGEVRVGGHS